MAEAKPWEELVHVSEGTLAPPEDPEEFLFPFNPYPIQVDFMRALFTALEEKKLGIFESPTGTGKSLSLLCGSLTWLEKREEARIQYLETVSLKIDIEKEEKAAKEATDWIQAQHELRQKKEIVNSAKRELAFLETLRSKRKKYLSKRSKNSFSLTDQQVWKKHKSENGKDEKNKTETKKSIEDELDDLMLNDDFAPEVYSDTEEECEDKDEEPEFHQNRIIFASRTHTQIGQFANELKRTEFGKKVTSCSLGSRQNLCINPDVTKLKNLSLMNERCLEIQKNGKSMKTSETKKLKSCTGCEFFNQTGIEELKNEILSSPMDIEELVSTGKELHACPYYASRKASKEAQLVMLPYNSILHKSTRDGIGLQTKNSVLLLDEAHNIIESISNMYSTSVNSGQIEDCCVAMKTYNEKFKNRFTANTMIRLKQLGFIARALQRILGKGPNLQQKVFKIQEFKVECGIETQDLYELTTFIKRSKIVFKLKGYLAQKQKIIEKQSELNAAQAATTHQEKEKQQQNQKGPAKTYFQSLSRLRNMISQQKPEDKVTPVVYRPQSGQSILNFVEFLKSLMTSHSGGRIIVDDKTNTLKFLLLSPSDHFTDLLISTRSIILAGGTMKPYDEVEDQLFQSAKERIYHFACDHVIPDENLLCISLNHGPSSRLLDFTYQNRKTSQMMEELARTILNLSKIVPGGLVCFLPSYDYEATLYTFLKDSEYLSKIELKKKVFRERKDSSCDTLLTDYSRQVKNCSTGAMLFAVVGGKLSEGINFSDALGRCVLVVGLPYPNVTSTEIKEKVQYVTDYFGKEKGSQLLANMCSKAVNQSIGRAIRHSQDYATIILVDNRFSKPSQQALLPNWILKRHQICDHFGPAVGSVAKFFATKRAMDAGNGN